MVIRKAEHVAIIVKDMEKSIEFYSKLFGYELRARGQNKTRDMAFLRNPNQPGFEIELIRDLVPLGPYGEQGLVNHLAFTVDDIQEAIAFFKEQGIKFHTDEPNTAIDGGKTIFFNGPNEEFLQLVQPVNR